MWKYLDRNTILDAATQKLNSLNLELPVPADTFGRSKMIRIPAPTKASGNVDWQITISSHQRCHIKACRLNEGLGRSRPQANRGNRSRLAFKAYAPRISPMRIMRFHWISPTESWLSCGKSNCSPHDRTTPKSWYHQDNKISYTGDRTSMPQDVSLFYTPIYQVLLNHLPLLADENSMAENPSPNRACNFIN